jgi:LmbE family N-acetylglucosaminyl deacetylase
VLPLVLSRDRTGPLKLLCLGAHSDDVEIGCGGTVLRLAEEFPDLVVRWIVFSATGVRETEARNSAAAFLDGVPDKRIDLFGFRDGYFPFQGTEIKDCFERLKREFDPSLILTHWQGDAHQDHRLLSQLTINTFRDHLVLEYEIPKYENDMSSPSFFVPLTRAQMKRKSEIILHHFASQKSRAWFTEETFMALARLRGIGCNAREGLAEGFHVRKIVY